MNRQQVPAPNTGRALIHYVGQALLMKMQQVQQQNATVGFVYHTLNKRGRVYFDGLYYTGETLTAAGQWLCKAYSSRELAIFQVDRVQP